MNVSDAFVADLTTRAAAIHELLNELFPDGDSEAIDRTLMWYEFKRVRPELESTLSKAVRALNYKIAAGYGGEVTRDEYQAAETEFRDAYDLQFESFKPTCRYEDLDRIQNQSERLRGEKNFRTALAHYAALDEQLTSFEQSTSRAYIEMEWAAEMQSDIARGK